MDTNNKFEDEVSIEEMGYPEKPALDDEYEKRFKEAQEAEDEQLG